MIDDRELRWDGAPDARYTLVLAHGAGAGMDSRFLTTFAGELAARGDTAGGIRVVRFEFPYMRRVRERGVRQRPDPMPALLARYRDVLAHLAVEPSCLVLGGKSLGGRVATHLAADTRAAGLVCLGYPFHPPRAPERLRTEPLRALDVPTLICQGTRDPFGTYEEVATYELPASIHLHWLADGDHDFVPRKRSGRTSAANMDEALAAALGFIGALAAPPGA
jgi:uncharacterized protein